MFIKTCTTTDKKTKIKYTSHKLVESYRDINGVSRHRVILNLGTLDLPKKRWKELSYIMECRLSGQKSFVEEDVEMASLADGILKHNQFKKVKAQEKFENVVGAEIVPIDLNSVGTSYHRTLGAELVADTFWGKLDFDKILKDCSLTEKQISLAKAIILGRLISPASEFSTWKWFQEQTALIEMTKVDLTGIGKDSFYEIGDILLKNKEAIEKKLLGTENLLFPREGKVYLYDLTNVYFEGNCRKNSSAKRGHSKEKRTDCPLVTLALMVDSQGFPIFSNIYDGNQSEAATLKDILEKLEEDTAKFSLLNKPILIMDRGIATKKNIAMIIENGYPYTVINRKNATNSFLEEFKLIKNHIDKASVTETVSDISKEAIYKTNIPEGWKYLKEHQDVFVKKVFNDGECSVLCISVGREAKEKGMDALKEKRFLEDMVKLKQSFVKGNILTPFKIGERIGRIKSKYPSAAKYFNVELKISDDNKKVTELSWSKKEISINRSNETGCYVIETTQADMTAVEIWNQYMNLTRVEGAFQDLKSELGLRPVYHQNSVRTESHLFIGVLAYHLLNSIEFSLKIAGIKSEWKTIKKTLSTHQRSTVILKGEKQEVYHIRTSSNPESEHNIIFRALNVKDNLKRKKTCVLQRL